MNQFKNAAFSLLELTVVIFVLSALTALLVPPFLQARERSHQAACSSNLRQLGMAASLYTSDYGGSYVPAVGSVFNNAHIAKAQRLWPDLLKPYTGQSVLACPSRITYSHYKGRSVDVITCGYAYNNYLSQSSTRAGGYILQGRQEGRIKKPASVVLFCDTRAGILTASRPDTIANFAHADLLYPDVIESEIKAAPPGATRHNGGANYVFVDGHVHWLKPSALTLGPACSGSAPCFGL